MSILRIFKPVFLLAILLSLFSNKALAEGTFDVSVSQLPDFRGVYPGHFSDVQFYYVNGSELGQNLVISVEGPFRISLGCYEDFESSLSLTPSNGIIGNTRIYVRFVPENTGNKQGTISHQAGIVGPISISLSGQGIESTIPPGYYNSATSVGKTLKTQLFNIINNHQTQTYSSLWGHFEQTDATFSGKVWDIYSDIPCQEPPYVFTFVEDQDTGSGGNTEGDVFNREHSMPQSWFNGQSPMYTDLFHLWPVDKKVNSQRGSFPYGEVNNFMWISQNGGKLGPNVAGGYNGTAFEPIDAYKGDIARGYLYMITRYQDQIENWTYNESGQAMLDNNRYPGFKPWAINMLMQWHQHDPVSQKEIIRNHAVYQVQGNRNPFIDHPELVDRIWGDTIAYVGIQHVAFLGFPVYPNPASGWFMIDAPYGSHSLEIYSLCGKRLISQATMQGEIRISTTALKSGVYILVLKTSQGIFREKLVIKKY